MGVPTKARATAGSVDGKNAEKVFQVSARMGIDKSSFPGGNVA